MNKALNAFINSEECETNSLVSSKGKLLSYGWYELAKWDNNMVIVRNGGLFSSTTKKQYNKLIDLLKKSNTKFQLSEKETPFDKREML